MALQFFNPLKNEMFAKRDIVPLFLISIAHNLFQNLKWMKNTLFNSRKLMSFENYQYFFKSFDKLHEMTNTRYVYFLKILNYWFSPFWPLALWLLSPYGFWPCLALGYFWSLLEPLRTSKALFGLKSPLGPKKPSWIPIGASGVLPETLEILIFSGLLRSFWLLGSFGILGLFLLLGPFGLLGPYWGL